MQWSGKIAWSSKVPHPPVAVCFEATVSVSCELSPLAVGFPVKIEVCTRCRGDAWSYRRFIAFVGDAVEW